MSIDLFSLDDEKLMNAIMTIDTLFVVLIPPEIDVLFYEVYQKIELIKNEI